MAISITLNILHLVSGTNYGNIKFSTVFDNRSKEKYLEKNLPIRVAIDAVNSLNTNSNPVAFFAPPLAAGLKSDALYTNWYNTSFLNETLKAKNSKQLLLTLKKYNVNYVITDDNWERPNLVALAKLSTIEIAKFGSISLRTLEQKKTFVSELLVPPYTNKGDTWYFTGGKSTGPNNNIIVNLHTPAHTIIPITEGETYRLTATLQSISEETQARLQVNWSTSNGSFISTNIEVVECKEIPSTYSMDVVAPNKASHATIYAVGHTDKNVSYLDLSFKR